MKWQIKLFLPVSIRFTRPISAQFMVLVGVITTIVSAIANPLGIDAQVGIRTRELSLRTYPHWTFFLITSVRAVSVTITLPTFENTIRWTMTLKLLILITFNVTKEFICGISTVINSIAKFRLMYTHSI